MSEQAWSGRFQRALSPLAMTFGASLAFDRRLALHDIRASLAHAHMLARQGILSTADETAIDRGLSQIAEELRQNRFVWREEREDVHLNIEGRLTELVGEAGKRLHTARSRNDQTVTSLRLWLRDETDRLSALLIAYRKVLLDLAEKHAALPMPGYTHLQVAQPITLGHHWMAYDAMASRDQERLQEARRRINVLPLGAAALAGTSYPIDRQQVARELDFAALCENSLDAVSDRDFALEFTFAAATLMIHLSRLSEELILWASRGLVHLPEDFCTGSSIMPQKINPDVPELVRGKTGRVCGHLLALLMLMKGQPLAYNKDNQEDKEPLFDTVDTTASCLTVLTAMLPGLRFDERRLMLALERYSTATDLADYLVHRGMAFRDAHEAVSRIVRDAEARDCDLQQLSLADIRRHAPSAQEDVMAHLTIEHAVNSRNHHGGTAPQQVREAISRARQALSAGVAA